MSITKPCPYASYIHISRITPGTVTQPIGWAACSSALSAPALTKFSNRTVLSWCVLLIRVKWYQLILLQVSRLRELWLWHHLYILGQGF